MQKIIKLECIPEIRHFIKIFEIFKSILNHLALPDLDFELQKEYLEKFNNYTEQELTLNRILRFQYLFKNLLNKSFIQDSLKVHDLVREAFLNKIAIRSPNCLTECRDFHGCCHGNYSVELIDYNRIISERLFPLENFSYKNGKYRLKLRRIGNDPFCSAFDYKTKCCLIHKYKPPTCSKYPLITNVFNWNKEKKQWVGHCAHGGTWTTYVSPVILQGLSKLWIKTILLWEREQDFLSKFESKLNINKIKIGKKLLTVRSNKIYNLQSIISLLSEEFSKKEIIQVFNLFKT
ncbi:MAG: YkgJ family cysteine cluster protein [Candidatus Hodarchaeota archaeon]